MSDTNEKVVAVKVYEGDPPLRANSKHTVELAKLNQKYTRLYDELEKIRSDIDYKERTIRNQKIREQELLKEIGANSAAIQQLLTGMQP